MGSPDYNSHGFDSSSGDGVFADPGTDPGSIDDYNSWDWKQIMAAINGMSAGTGSDANLERAKGISDPQSLMDAAGHFLNAQVVLSGIAKSIADQAKALAGDNGPWKGDAADAFLDMINTFSRQVKATSDVLSGGEAGNSVPQQLADNSVNLYNAQVKISDIDTWYANQAIKMGVKPMSNGLIPIHEKPELVQMMTSDMRAVLKSLAGEYQVTIDSVHTPPPVTSPTNNPNVPDNLPDSPNPDLTEQHLPNLDPLDARQFSAPDTSAMDAPTMPNLDPTEAFAKPAPFSGGTDLGGDMPKLGGPGEDGLGNDTLDPSALDQALNPAAFPGGTGLNGGVPTLAPSPFPSALNTDGEGLPTGSKLAEAPSSWADDVAPEDFPGDTGVGGAGGLGAGKGLGDVSPEGFPGGLGMESGLPNGLKTPSSLNDALESPALDEKAQAFPGGLGTGDGVGSPLGAGGMPMMPGMGSGAPQQNGAVDPSDASGLLDSDAKPWSGDPSVADEIGGKGAKAGGDGLGLPLDEHEAQAFPGGLGTGDGVGSPLGAGGMPMMPGMGSGAPQQNGAVDPSDASGLLDADAEPWTGDPDIADEIGGKGALAGGDGLGLPFDGEEAEALPGELETAEGGPLGAGGMPMMPGAGGSNPAASASTDPSDASGLLEPDAEPWTGDVDAPDEIEGGAEAGGEGLALPGAVAPGPLPEGVMIGSDGLPIAPEPTTAPAAPLATAAEPGMPGMMPGASAAPGGQQQEERSDASGLLAPEAEPWSAEAEPDGDRPVVGAHDGLGEGVLPAALLGAAAGAAAGAALGAASAPSDEEPAERRHRHRDEDGAAVILLPVAGGQDRSRSASAEPGPEDPDDEDGNEEATEPVPPQQLVSEEPDEDPYDQELPDDHVAVAPAGGPEAEDTEAWDSAGASFVPLLWSVPTEDEEEVRAPGYATEEASTWTGRTGAPVEGEEDGPRLSTWRPNRTASTAPGETVVPAVPLRSFSGDPSEYAAELPPHEPVEEDAESEEELEKPSRGIADLLVQEGDTWGSAASDGAGAVL
ncbi:WXG100 family type VII secretion target [Streptomyces sp. NPDC052040]|uniref:WXG100 family type VII secretion target n=1 Tax=Streptomyces sp. NPDC052040 TaxID=3365682 RepID=UPI0037CECB56